ncbi:MAG TPA: ArdC family protein [Candidatus Saccharimonadales bacterium]|nr:ArdC family protein [Candidatus Saccharimonadales bacterium]
MPNSERFGRSQHGRSTESPVEPGAAPHAELLERLEQAIGQIHDSESFRRYLDAQARFHDYSFGNVALILSQHPDATLVAGYNAWLRLHRYVRKGEKGIRILS